jgi:hypothetical protein
MRGRAVAQAVSCWRPARHVGFVVDKVAVGQVFSDLVSLANHSTNFSINIITWGWHNRSIGGHNAEWTQLDSNSTIIIN